MGLGRCYADKLCSLCRIYKNPGKGAKKRSHGRQSGSAPLHGNCRAQQDRGLGFGVCSPAWHMRSQRDHYEVWCEEGGSWAPHHQQESTAWRCDLIPHDTSLSFSSSLSCSRGRCWTVPLVSRLVNDPGERAAQEGHVGTQEMPNCSRLGYPGLFRFLSRLWPAGPSMAIRALVTGFSPVRLEIRGLLL